MAADRLQARGRAWEFGDFVDAEELCLTQYFDLGPEQLRKHVFETLRPEFVDLVAPGDVVVGGRGFGCGAGHDHCNVALKATGVSGVIATTFGTQFYRHSVDHAVPLLQAEEATRLIDDGDEIEVDFVNGEVLNLTTGATFVGKPMRGAHLDVVLAGGLIDYIREQMPDTSEVVG